MTINKRTMLGLGLTLLLGACDDDEKSTDNLTDASYREATSRIKQLAPNPGRNVSLVYRVLF